MVSTSTSTKKGKKKSQANKLSKLKTNAIESPGTPGLGTPGTLIGDHQFSSKLWKILFANVNRSIDELYQFCEEEGEHARFNDILDLLDRSSRDFNKLVEKTRELKRWEEAQMTAQGSSIMWEVRLPTKASSISSALLAEVTEVSLKIEDCLIVPCFNRLDTI